MCQEKKQQEHINLLIDSRIIFQGINALSCFFFFFTQSLIDQAFFCFSTNYNRKPNKSHEHDK